MLIRILAAGATLFLLAGPASANCEGEVSTLEQEVTSAETGAATGSTGMPATKHQEETLAGDQKPAESTGTGSSVESTVPSSPHQRQVLRGTESAEDMDEVRTLLDEAKASAAAGDEQDCLAKVQEAKRLLGTE